MSSIQIHQGAKQRSRNILHFNTLAPSILRSLTQFGYSPHKTKLRSLSPQANYTDRATADCRQRQLLRVEGVAWSVQRIPTAVNLGFIDRSLYFFIQVAHQLFSRG
jgi:hypothetical protein